MIAKTFLASKSFAPDPLTRGSSVCSASLWGCILRPTLEACAAVSHPLDPPVKISDTFYSLLILL